MPVSLPAFTCDLIIPRADGRVVDVAADRSSTREWGLYGLVELIKSSPELEEVRVCTNTLLLLSSSSCRDIVHFSSNVSH